MKENFFSKNLKNLRLETKTSQKKLAKELNVSIKSISHWETGYSEPSISQLLQLSDFFEVSLDELLCKN